MEITLSKSIELVGSSWGSILHKEFNESYMQNLIQLLRKERKEYLIHPNPIDVFKAFKLTPYNTINVVIVGEEPYSSTGLADGLAFSVSSLTATIPNQLIHILDEADKDMEMEGRPYNPDLSRWSEQGVFLLNNVLTVRDNQPNSHANIGWERFTQTVIDILAQRFNPTVFMLWGEKTHELSSIIQNDTDDFHLIIKTSHPNTLNYEYNFKDSTIFRRTNNYLISLGKHPIAW
jgi:uracil-DNA glycosylase